MELGITKWNPSERTHFLFKPFHNCYLHVTAETEEQNALLSDVHSLDSMAK